MWWWLLWIVHKQYIHLVETGIHNSFSWYSTNRQQRITHCFANTFIALMCVLLAPILPIWGVLPLWINQYAYTFNKNKLPGIHCSHVDNRIQYNINLTCPANMNINRIICVHVRMYTYERLCNSRHDYYRHCGHVNCNGNGNFWRRKTTITLHGKLLSDMIRRSFKQMVTRKTRKTVRRICLQMGT